MAASSDKSTSRLDANASQCVSWILKRIFCSSCRRPKTFPSSPCGNSEIEGQLQHKNMGSSSSKAFKLFLRKRALEAKQEAEERRREGLRRIADMNSSTGIDPLEVFPREIWEKILGKMTPEDLDSICEVHDLFRNILDDDMIQNMLLPLVVTNHKIPFVQKYLLPPPDASLFEPFRERQDLALLVDLRRVCKTVRDSVDGWIESRILHLMRNSEAGSIYITAQNLNSAQLNLCYNWHKVERLQDTTLRLGMKMPIRFVPKSLNVNFLCFFCKIDPEGHGMDMRLSDRFPIFKDSFAKFLETVGHQILHMSIGLPSASLFARLGVHLPMMDLYDLIRKWLFLTPNLKWLEIDASEVDSLSKSQRNILDLTLQRNKAPMPTLPELERIDFSGCSPPLEPISYCVLVANPQIKRVTVMPHYAGRYNADAELDVYKDLAVRTLPLETSNLGRTLTASWGSKLLNQLLPNTWNLKRLTLCLVWTGCRRLHALDRVFEWLEKFPSLEDLELHITYFRLGNSFLQLPNLKHFKLEIGTEMKWSNSKAKDFLFSFEFLLHCSKLESLDWKVFFESASVYRHWERHQERMLTGNFTEPNIWSVFPKLRAIRFRVSQPADAISWEYFERKCGRWEPVSKVKLTREQFNAPF